MVDTISDFAPTKLMELLFLYLAPLKPAIRAKHGLSGYTLVTTGT